MSEKRDNSIWPHNKKFAICLTHDVDRVKKTYQYFTHFVKTKDFYHLKSFFIKKQEPYWNFERIMEIEKKHHVKSTFFFLNEKRHLDLLHPKKWALSLDVYSFHDEKIAEIIQKLHANGWEIGVHGSHDSYRNENLLKEEKKELEEIIGDEVTGIRQHYLNLEIPKTWKIQSNAGFKYDASFGFRDKVGFRDDKFLPFHPLNDSFLEIPLIIMDGPLFRNSKSFEDTWKNVIMLIDQTESHGALLTVLWHQRVFNENEFPNWSKVYENFIALCKKRGAWITTATEIEQWWNSRCMTEKDEGYKLYTK